MYRVVHTNLVGEYGFIVEDVLSPIHQCIYIFGSGQLRGSLIFNAIFPKVLVATELQ